MFSWSYSTKTAINNGILSTLKSSPMKDITSDGNNSFSMNRQQFVKTNRTETASTPAIILQKKWYGSNNKDASTITDSRRISEIGNGSLNSSKKDFAFKTTSDINVSREALKRVRSGGCIVPAKKIHKYTNAPIFY
jgi:hypothetical protein